MIPTPSSLRAPSSSFGRVRAARRPLAVIVAVGSGAGFLLAAGLARADEEAAQPLPALPAPSAVTCALGDHAGVDAADAKTAADMICHDLAAKGAPAAAYEIRFGKLGGKILLVVRGHGDERRALLTGIDKVTVASPRIAQAIAEGKALDETQTVKNVLRSEAQPVVRKPGQMGFNGGILGVAPVGQGATPSPGVDLGLLYHADHFGLGAQLRIAPNSTTDATSLSYTVLGTGARYYLGENDVAPYAGAGVGLAHLCVKRADSTYGGEDCGTGFGAFGEAGVEALRTHRVAFTEGVRADVPFFRMHGQTYTAPPRGSSGGTTGEHWSYAVPVSVLMGMMFH
jgi:hypothetical protein